MTITTCEKNKQEFWYARELQEALEYSQWRRFRDVISKAMETCESSGYEASDHFTNVGKMIKRKTKSKKNSRIIGR